MRMIFEVHIVDDGSDVTVKNGILFEMQEDGDVTIYDGAEEPYTAAVRIRELCSELIRMAQESMERKMEEANRVLSDDLK